MAGTDRTREPKLGGPAVILVRPQLGENIGTAARAMLNFGLTDLRLVSPRDGWPNAKALAAASRADAVLDQARLFETTVEAVADLHHLFAATARSRDMLKPVLTPRRAAAEMRRQIAAGGRPGLLFGPEKAGLDSDEVALADAIVQVPLNPAFSSLNLAQAVLLIGYEWFLGGDAMPETAGVEGITRPATRDELEGFLVQLEEALGASGFLRPPEKAPRTVRNLRNIFTRAGLMAQEVRTLRGVVSSFTKKRGGG